MRPPIMVTNTDRSGKVMDGKWYVRVGKRYRTFNEAAFKASGLDWLKKQLG